jgi:hypothetical protein
MINAESPMRIEIPHFGLTAVGISCRRIATENRATHQAKKTRFLKKAGYLL